jgi:RNA 2',3'-cyclic 3'-phosphodiesterase
VPRAFIAIQVPPVPALLGAVGDLRVIGHAIKPVAPENLHLTLRFLGDAEPQQFHAITEAIRKAVAGVEPFDLTLHGVGLFPDMSRPTVVWAGVREDQPVQSIVEHLAPLLEVLGFQPDPRPWVCHLTLARIKSRPPAELGRFLNRYRNADFGAARVHSVELMLSDLLPTGPQYSVASTLPLVRVST